MVKEAIKKVGKGGVRRLVDFKTGFFSPFRAMGYIFRNPGTLKFALPPVPIIGTLLFAALYFGVGYSDDLLALMWSQPTGEAWYVTWLLGPLWYVLLFVVGLTMVVLSVVVTALLGIPLAGPFMEMLAEKVEAIETGFEAPFEWGVFLRNIGITLIHVSIFTTVGLTITAFAFGVSFIPVIGQAIALLVSFTVVPMMLAFTPLDYPMTVRLWSFGDKMRFVWRNLSYFYGFALATYLFLYVPFLNLFLLPACVVAATLVLIKFEKEGRIDFRDRRKEVLASKGHIEIEARDDAIDKAVEEAPEAVAQESAEVEETAEVTA